MKRDLVINPGSKKSKSMAVYVLPMLLKRRETSWMIVQLDAFLLGSQLSPQDKNSMIWDEVSSSVLLLLNLLNLLKKYSQEKKRYLCWKIYWFMKRMDGAQMKRKIISMMKATRKLKIGKRRKISLLR
jgi:hypothetical protein